MSEGSGSQDHCGNCGAEVRPGTSFCVSCGASLAPAPEASASAHDTVTSGQDPYEQSVGPTQSIYAEYHLHKRFFQEARDGLIRFSERLKQDKEPSSEGLTQNDLADPLLQAQKGVNKAEEYRETLTTPMFRNESSQQEAQFMLAELRAIQRDVLTFLEAFWDKLEATEGHREFKDEFARWYMNSLEPHVPRDSAQREGNTRTTHGEPRPARLDGSSTDAHYGTGGIPIYQLPNRIINWFRGLPSTPKLIIVGLVLLLLLTILSPLAFVVAAVLLVVSIIGLIVRRIQREPLKGWGIVAVASIVSLFVFDGISNTIYGTGSSDNNKIANSGGSGKAAAPKASMPEAEREYVTRTAKIMNEAIALGSKQAEVRDKCGGECAGVSVTAANEVAGNTGRMDKLVKDATQLKPPEGYNKSHEAFVESLRKHYEIVFYLSVGGPLINDPYWNGLLLDAKNYREQMVEQAPTDGQKFYQQKF